MGQPDCGRIRLLSDQPLRTTHLDMRDRETKAAVVNELGHTCPLRTGFGSLMVGVGANFKLRSRLRPSVAQDAIGEHCCKMLGRLPVYLRKYAQERRGQVPHAVPRNRLTDRPG